MQQPPHADAPQGTGSRPGGCGGWALDGAVILAIVILLGIYWAGLMRSGAQLTARQSQCGRNQSQIYGAMVAYATSEETAWPEPRGTTGAWKLPAGPITNAVDGAKYTAGSFELVAASQSISNSLFKCPSTAFGGPSRQVKPSASDTSVRWGWDPANGVAVSYAFDWASPADPSSERVILADREVKAHRDFLMVTFGDAHVKKVKLVEVERGTGVLVTESIGTSPSKFGTGVQPDDDLYSNEGDAGNPLTPGKGDPLRAWVK